MFKHDQACESMINALNDLHSIDETGVVALLKQMMRAQKFSVNHTDATNLLGIFKGSRDHIREVEVQFPFEDVYIEFMIPQESDDVCERVALFLSTMRKVDDRGYCPGMFFIPTMFFKDGAVVTIALGRFETGGGYTVTPTKSITIEGHGEVKDISNLYVAMAMCLMYSLAEGSGGVRSYVPWKLRGMKAARKRNRKHPLVDYQILRIDLSKVKRPSTPLGGHHASPRLHLRRGHWRHYKSGVKRWIKPRWVGDKERGVVHKDYVIRTGEEEKV